jgi:hypothetical protein
MKVRITGHSGEPLTFSRWWYAKHDGEIFDVQTDEKMNEYFYVMLEHKGRLEKHHIRKVDCEVVEKELSA